MPDCFTLLHISYFGLTYDHIHNAIYLMDAAGVAVLQKFLLEDSVFAEVLAEVLEDAVTVLFQIEFVWFLAISCGCKEIQILRDANPAICIKWLVILLADFLIFAPDLIS